MNLRWARRPRARRSPISVPDGIGDYRVHLGELGRASDSVGAQAIAAPLGDHTTNAVKSWVPLLERHLAKGTLKPLEYEVVEGTGYDAVVGGIVRQEKGGLKKKLVVRVQE